VATREQGEKVYTPQLKGWHLSTEPGSGGAKRRRLGEEGEEEEGQVTRGLRVLSGPNGAAEHDVKGGRAEEGRDGDSEELHGEGWRRHSQERQTRDDAGFEPPKKRRHDTSSDLIPTAAPTSQLEEERGPCLIFTGRGSRGQVPHTTSYWPSDGSAPHIVASWAPGVLAVWDSGSGRRLASLECDGLEPSCLITYTASGGSPRVAMGCERGLLRIWNGDGHQVVHTINAYSGGDVSRLATYSEPVKGRTRLISGNAFGGLKVWDGDTGNVHTALEPLDLCVTDLTTFTPADGSPTGLVAASTLGPVYVYDPEAGTLLHRLVGQAGNIYSISCFEASFGAPHVHVVSSCRGGMVRLWSLQTGLMIHSLEHDCEVLRVAAYKEHLQGRDRIVTADEWGVIRVFDAETGTLHRSLTGHHGEVDRLLVFELWEGPRLLSSSADGSVRLWRPEEGRLLHVLESPGGDLMPSTLHLVELEGGRQGLVVGCTWFASPSALQVWDIGKAAPPPSALGVRPAHKTG
jgi:hypothetical protein